MKRRSDMRPDLYLLLLGDVDAVLFRGGQGGEQVGERQQVLHLLAEMEQLQLAACSPSVDVEADEGAETHAIDVSEVLEVEGEELAGRGDLLQVGVEGVGEPGDEPPVALYEGDIGLTDDVVAERLGGCFFGHGGSVRYSVETIILPEHSCTVCVGIGREV